jgi:hypothetical protein
MATTPELDIIIGRLLASPTIRLERAALVPASPGLYAIYTTTGECLYAGQSANLRNRLLRDHFAGGGKSAGSDLIQQVQDRGRAVDRASARGFMEGSLRVSLHRGSRRCGIRGSGPNTGC